MFDRNNKNQVYSIERVIIPGRLKDARIYRGYSQQDLADKINVSKQSVSSYEKGNKNPSIEVLSNISKTLKFPFDFFYKEMKYKEINPVYFFRSMSIPKKNKEMLYKKLEYFNSEILGFCENYINLGKNNLVEVERKDYFTQEDIRKIVKDIRQKWGVHDSPINDLMYLMQKNGCIVSYINLNSEKTDGFSCWIEDRPIILVNNIKDSATRLRFTLAHELGHIILHKNLKNEESLKQRETEANFFAGELLFPTEQASNEIYSTTLDSFIPIKYKWKISIAAIIRRCLDLELITEDRHLMLQKQLSKRKWRIVEPLDDMIKNEEPRLIQDIFDLLISKNIVTKNYIIESICFDDEELIEICGLRDDFFKEELNIKLNKKTHNLSRVK